MPEDIKLSASLDASDAVSSAQQLTKVLNQVSNAIAGADAAIKMVPTGIKSLTKTQQNAITQYEKLLQITKQYTNVQIANKEASEAGARGNLRLVSRLNELNRAMSQVEKTSRADYEARRRTLGLMQLSLRVTEQYSRVASQATTAQEREARVAVQVAAAKEKEARARAANALAAEREARTNLRQQAAIEQAAMRAAQITPSQARTTTSRSDPQALSSLPTARYAMYEVAAAYSTASAAALGFGVASVKSAVQYEAAFAQVSRTTGESVAALTDLRKELVQLSTDIPVTFEDLSRISSLGAQMGVGSAGLDEFTETVAKFSASSNVSVDEASTAFGRLSNLLKIPVVQYNNLGSAVAELGVNSAATESEILNSAQAIAGTAHSAGISTQAVLGLSSAMASLKISPELGRSTLQRVFSELDRAISDGGDQLQKWAAQLGLTTEEVIALRRANPDELFTRLLASFDSVVRSGGDITGVFDALQIYSLRTAPTLQRLAASVGMVSNSIDQARLSYAAGTFLDQSVQPVFSTIESNATKASNAVKGLLSSFVIDTSAESGIKGILQLVTELANVLNFAIPSSVKVGALAFITIIGVWAAYKAMISLVIAGMFAFGTVTQQGITRADISLRGLRNVAAEAFGTMRSSADAATAAVNANSAALQRNAVAARANQGAAVGSRGASAAGTRTAVAAGAGSGISSGIRGFIGSVGSIVKWSAAIGAVATATDALYSWITAASRAAEHQKELQKAFIEGGGGMESFAAAVRADTQALEDVGGDVSKLPGYIGTYTTALKDAGDGTATLETKLTNATGTISTFNSKPVEMANSLSTATSAQRDLATQVGVTNDAIAQQSLVIGKNTKEWAVNAVETAIKDADIEPSDWSNLNIAGQRVAGVLSKAIEDNLKGDSGAITGAVAQLLAEANAEYDAAYTRLRVTGTPDDGRARLGFDDAAENLRIITQLYNALGGADVDIANTNSQLSIHAQLMGEVADDTGDATEATDTYATQLEKLNDQLNKAAEEFMGYIDGLTGAAQAQSDLAEGFAKLGQSIADNGTDFSVLTEEGRANLDALLAVVNQQGEMLAQQIKDRQIDQQQAGQQMYQFMVELMTELGNIGIPTDQIDFLVNYLKQVTQAEWQVTIGADIGAAVQGLNQLSSYASFIQRQIATVGGSARRLEAGIDALIPTTVIPQYSGPTVFGNQRALNGILEQAKANRELENAAKAAGKAGKAAGKAAKDAAKEAADELKRLTDAYKNFGKDAFSGVTSEGDVFESLQKMGQAISENGAKFDTLTQAGRDNFSALSGVFSSFGTVLSAQVEAGVLTAQQASVQLKQFAGGVYLELVKLGVPQKQIEAFFKGMGVNAAGWDKTNKSVKQFGGFITAAADAVDGLTDKMAEQQKALDDYVDRLDKAMSTVTDRAFRLPNAIDAASSAYNKMANSIAEVNKQIKELTDEGAGLDSTIAKNQAIARGAATAYAKALARGDTELAGAYAFQRDVALAQVTSAQDKKAENNKKIGDLQGSTTDLKSNTDAAISNRAAVQDLLSAYEDQIKAYAASGATQADVSRKAAELEDKFKAQIRTLGFADSDVQTYTGTFKTLVTTIGTVPKNVDIKANADTSAATAALNAIPKSGTFTTQAVLEPVAYRHVRDLMAGLQATVTKTIKPIVDPGSLGSAGRALDSLAKPRTMELTVRLGNNNITYDQFKALKGGYASGGVIPGYASGGLIPGRAPMDPRVDNILAQGPQGLIRLRSQEFVMSQPAVKYYGLPTMEALNRMQLPPWWFNGPQVVQSATASPAPAMGDIHITTVNPQAEPTSKTINYARALAAGLGGLR